MKLYSPNIKNHQSIPEKYARCKLDNNQAISKSDDISPSFIFSKITNRAASLALICIDLDAPIESMLRLKDKLMIAYDCPRREFCHLIAINIDPKVSMISEASLSKVDGITLGLNDYSSGNQLGYSGPCPPSNDLRIHRYRFSLLALDIESLETPKVFRYEQIKQVLEARTIEQASFTATYTLNSGLKLNYG